MGASVFTFDDRTSSAVPVGAAPMAAYAPGVPQERAHDALADGLWDWDLATGKLWHSDSLPELLGILPGADSLTWAKWIGRVHPQDAEHVRTEFARVKSSAGVIDLQARFRHNSGGYRWLRLRGRASEEAGGTPGHVSGGVTDITNHKQLFLQLQEHREDLAQRQRAASLDSLAGGIAHEFNNLLHAMRGYMSFVQEELTPGTSAARDAELAIATVDRAATLTKQLLGYSRQEASGSPSQNICEALHQLHCLLKPTLGEPIRLAIECPPQAFQLQHPAVGLSEALLNLCLNARDAMPQGGVLSLRAEKFIVEPEHERWLPELTPGRYCRLFVSDTGLGISEAVQRQIFTPFFTTKEVGRGTGLGLSLVHHLIERLEGRIEVYSHPGEGACFKLYLPVENEPMSVCVDKDRSGDQLQGGRVLYVEDEPLVQAVCQRMLENAGCQVVCVDGVAAALRTLAEQPTEFDLVLSDIVLPDGTGRELAAAIRDRDLELPVVLCTGYDPYAPQGQQLAEEGYDVLAKPFDRQQLRAVLGAALNRRLSFQVSC